MKKFALEAWHAVPSRRAVAVLFAGHEKGAGAPRKICP